MGWFDGASDVGGHHSSSHHHSSSKHHHNSGGSIFGGGGEGGGHHSSSKHHNSSGSIFGSGDHKHNTSRGSFFGFPRSSSSSYYRRSPRSGYLRRIYTQLRRLLRDLIYYMKRHPMKVFVLVIMPLITGGALTGLLARFGIRLPGGLERMFGGVEGGRRVGIGRGREGGLQFERRREEGGIGAALGGLGELGRGLGGGMGMGGGGIGNAIGIAKMFM